MSAGNILGQVGPTIRVHFWKSNYLGSGVRVGGMPLIENSWKLLMDGSMLYESVGWALRLPGFSAEAY